MPFLPIRLALLASLALAVSVRAAMIDPLPATDGFEGQLPAARWTASQGTLEKDAAVFAAGAASMKWSFQPGAYLSWRPEALAGTPPSPAAAKMAAGQPCQLGFKLSLYLRRQHPFDPKGDPQRPRLKFGFLHQGTLVCEQEYDLPCDGWNVVSDNIDRLLQGKKGAVVDEIRLQAPVNVLDAAVWLDEAVCGEANLNMGILFPAQKGSQTLPKGTRQGFCSHDAARHWKAGAGSRLAVDGERSLADGKSLKWEFTAGSAISYRPPAETLPRDGNGNVQKGIPLGFFFHLAKPMAGILAVEHLRDGVVVKRAWTHLNAIGWNAFYAQNPPGPYDEIRLVAPAEEASGTIRLDEFEHSMDPASKGGPALWSLLMPDFISDANAAHKPEEYPATDLDDYAVNPQQPLRKPSEIGMPSLLEVKRDLSEREMQVMRATIPPAAPPWRNPASAVQLDELRACYKAMAFQVHGGQVSGRPVRPMDGDRMAHWGAVNINDYLGYLQQLALAYQSPLPPPVKEEFRTYVDHSFEHLKHQPVKFCAPGWNGNYTTRYWIRAAVDLRPVLVETGHLDWYLEFLLAQHDLRLRIWRDPVYSDMDFLKNIIPKWAQAISLMEPGPRRWQRTHALRVFCERAYGAIDGGMPVAGGTMHHGCHHLSYGLGALGSLQELIEMLQKLGDPMDTSRVNTRYFNTVRLLVLSTCGELSPPNTDANNASAFRIDRLGLLLGGLQLRDGQGAYLMPREMQAWALQLVESRLAADLAAPKKMDGRLRTTLEDHRKRLVAAGVEPRPPVATHVAPVVSLVAHNRGDWMATLASYPYKVTALETRYANAKYARLMKAGSCFITYPDARGDGGMGSDGWQWNLVPGSTMALQPDWSLNRICFHKEGYGHHWASGGAQVGGRAIWGWVDPKGARHSSYAAGPRIVRLVTGLDRLKEEGKPIVTTLFQVQRQPEPETVALPGGALAGNLYEGKAAPATWLIDPLRTGYLIQDAGDATLKVTRGPQTWNFISNQYLKEKWDPGKHPNYDQTAANQIDARKAEELRPLFNERHGDFSTAILTCGEKPSRLLYSIYPNATAAIMEQAAAAARSREAFPVEVLHESDKVHAYHDRESGAFGFALFEDKLDFTAEELRAGGARHPLLASETGCFLFLQPDNGALLLNLLRTDPAYAGGLSFCLKGRWKVVAADVYGKPLAATAVVKGETTRLDVPCHGYARECAAINVRLEPAGNEMP